jgi:cytochrome c-type biogenesis protein CcmH/NrfG
MTGRGHNTYDLDRLATIEDELTFALRSLDDLEAERASGQVDDTMYERLHAAYTVRAADAARSRRQLTRHRPVVAARSSRTKVMVAAVLALLVAGLGVSLHLGSRARQPGATITGDSAAAPADATGQRPTFDAQAERSLVKGDLSGALRGYISALKVNPRDVEALSYAGWLTFLAGSTRQAVPLLQTAVRTDPSYPDAHAFLGIVLLRSHRQPDAGRAQLREYLRLVPSGQMSQQVRRVLKVATTPPRTRGRPTQ